MRIPARLGLLLLVAVMAFTCAACNRSQTTPSPAPATATSTPEPETVSSAEAELAPQIAPGQINVREVVGFNDEYNYWYIYGRVSNDTDQAVNNIEIEIQLQDINGNVLYSDTTYTSNYTLAVGETSPFTFYTYDAISGVDSIHAIVVNHAVTELNRANLDLFGITWWYDSIFNEIYISGNVTNNNADPVRINGLAASLIDADGHIASANSAYPFLYHLEPGISAPFTIMFNAPNDQAASLTNYRIYMDAEFTPPATFNNLFTSNEHYGYLDSYNDFHLVGLLTNNSDSYLNVRLIAGIYDDAGNCIDSSSLFLPVAIPPGHSIPYDFDLWGALDNVVEAYHSATQFEIYIDWYSSYQAYVTPVLITTTDNVNTYDGYSATFTGNIVNNTGRDLDRATVIVSLYNQTSGELIATDYTYVSGPIADDATIPYNAYLFPQADFEPANVEFTVIAYGQ